MKHFTARQLTDAIAYAATGEIAIHTHCIIGDRQRAPACFVRAVNRGEDIAHMFGQDALALRELASKLGVRVILIEREGTPTQHIDLVGKPLQLALAMCG